MNPTSIQLCFPVSLQLKVPGPVMPQRKFKQHRLITASRKINLPFVPFPGLILTFTLPKCRGHTSTVYLRVRTVEWLMSAQEFDCVVDEISVSLDMNDMLEVRGSPRIEQHFHELETNLRLLGFDTRTDMEALFWALHKTASGLDLGDLDLSTAPSPAKVRGGDHNKRRTEYAD